MQWPRWSRKLPYCPKTALQKRRLEKEQLYDRCIMMHITFIPYREFEEVLGIKGIDEYIHYGGIMSLSGINYSKEAIFPSARSAEEYIDTVIAKNIQHSLKMYEYGGHFRSLLDLYEKGGTDECN